MKLRTILTSIAVACLALFGVAPAAQAADPGPTIIFDANETGLDLAPSAADWSVRTGITAVVGSCDGGAYCVEFSLDECNSFYAAGCSWVADGTCHSSITSLAYERDYWFTVYIVSHEAGHCIQWFGGAGMFHLDSDRAVMGDGNQIKFYNEKGARLTNEDRQMAKAIYDGTW